MSEEIKIILKEIVDKIAGRRKKGGFKTDGSTHYSGIKNEHNIVLWLNQEESVIGKHLRPSSDYLVKHKGGTKCKADAIVVNTQDNSIFSTLSIKNHKTGTFDWLNSTKGFPDDVSTFLKESTKQMKANYSIHENLDSTREGIDTLFSNILYKLKNNDGFIREMMNSIYQKYTDGIIINCEKEQTLVYFEKKELKELQGIPDSQYFLKHTPGTCSAQIMRSSKNSFEEFNTYLRLRLVLNNGVNALVGTSLKNKTSVPCIKIQQDNVDFFLQSIENKLIEKIEKIEKNENII
jgi:hypothetical protein